MSTSTRLALALVVATTATAALAPAGAVAVPNQGTGPSSSQCDTLRARLARFHALATDPANPKAVREFYRARAVFLLERARRLGCPWATAQAVSATAATGQKTTAPAVGGVLRLRPLPTGTPKQDEYCAGVAKLVEEADAEGDRELMNGHNDDAQAWYDLADLYIDEATQNGCRFVLLRRPAIGADQRVPGTQMRRR